MINVLPTEEKKALIHEYRIRFLAVVFFLIALSGLLATLLLVPSYIYSKNKEQLAESKLEAFNKANPDTTFEDLSGTITDINAKLAILNANTPLHLLTRDIVNEFASTKPKGIYITQILYNERTDGMGVIQVSGVALDRTTLRDYKSVLQSNSHFKDVNLPISGFVKKSDIDFTISLVLK